VTLLWLGHLARQAHSHSEVDLYTYTSPGSSEYGGPRGMAGARPAGGDVHVDDLAPTGMGAGFAEKGTPKQNSRRWPHEV